MEDQWDTVILGCPRIAAFLLTGSNIKIAGRKRKLCAPLVFYPVHIETETLASEPVMFAVPDFSEPRFNVPVIETLMKQQGGSDEMLEPFLASFPNHPITTDRIYDLAKALEACIPGLDVSELYSFPDILPESEIKKRFKTDQSTNKATLKCLPVVALAMIENPPQTRGVLFELGVLSDVIEDDERLLSAPLAQVLGCPKTTRVPSLGNNSYQHVPAILSNPQQSALASARVAPVTMLIGPPGTGKSFTAAALAIDHVARGQAVLFAARTQQALDVIADKLEALLGTDSFVVRGGRHEYLRKLENFLEQLLRGVFHLPEVDPATFEGLELRQKILDKRIGKLEKQLFELCRAEQSLGLLCSGLESGFFLALSRPLRRMLLRRKVSTDNPLWEIMTEYQNLLEERLDFLSGAFRWRHGAVI